MIIFRRASVIAEAEQAADEYGIGCRACATVTVGAEVLAGVEADAARIAGAPDTLALALRAIACAASSITARWYRRAISMIGPISAG